MSTPLSARTTPAPEKHPPALFLPRPREPHPSEVGPREPSAEAPSHRLDTDFYRSVFARLVGRQDQLLELVSSGAAARVQTLNLHHLHLARTDAQFRGLVDGAEHLTADGWPLLVPLRALAKCRKVASPHRVTGADLVDDLVHGRNARPVRIALLGAAAEAGDRLAKALQGTDNRLVHRLHSDADGWDCRSIAARLNELNVDVALVAVTPPRSETISDGIRLAGFAGYAIAVGGAVDMATDMMPRAPRQLQRIGAEWLYRMLREPRRLVRRYLAECLPLIATEIVPAVLDVHRSRFRSRPSRRDTEGSTVVVHVGLMGDQPGGMAQVVNEYLKWSSAEMRVRGLLTARRKRDPLGPLLFLRAAVHLLVHARRGGRVAVFHLSEGGSFVREGGLLALASACGISAIAHLHGADFVQFAARRPGLVRAVLARCRLVLVLTEPSRAVVQRLLPDARVAVVANPVDVPAATPEKSKTVVFGGELSHRKGFDVLLEAWEEVSAKHPSWELVVAGPNNGKFDLGTVGKVRYLGALQNAELRGVQARAQIAVLPSRREALPVFLLESMASRCAVISTRVGEIGSLLSPRHGVLVDAGDAAELAQGLDRLMSDTAYRTSVADAGHQRVLRTYSSDVVRSHLAQLWTSTAVPPRPQHLAQAGARR